VFNQEEMEKITYMYFYIERKERIFRAFWQTSHSRGTHLFLSEDIVKI
jgi:hypothetical protein